MISKLEKQQSISLVDACSTNWMRWKESRTLTHGCTFIENSGWASHCALLLHHTVRYCRVSVCRFIVSCVVLQTVQRRRRRTALLWGHRPPPRTQAAARKGPSHIDEVTLIKDEPMLQSVFAFDCFFNDRRGFKVKCSFIGVMSCLSSCSAVRSQGSLRPRPPPRPHPPPPVLPLLPPPPPPRRSPLGSPPSPRRPSPPTAWGTSVESCWWRRCRLTVRTDLFYVFTILRRWRDLEAL